MSDNLLENEEQQPTNNNNQNWSDLDCLLLWMIKGRLVNPIDRLRFGVVCKYWHSSSKTCPQSFIPDAEEREPWIMMGEESNESKRTFINLSSNTKYVSNHEDFRGAIFYGSKDGWLLFAKKHRFFCQLSVFLLNPITNSKIEMPCLTEKWIEKATFSTTATATIVVLVTRTLNLDFSFTITLSIARSGDDKWNEFDYHSKPEVAFGLVKMFIGGGGRGKDQYVYCIEYDGQVIGFDLVNHKWIEYMPPITRGPTMNLGRKYCYVESIEQVLKINPQKKLLTDCCKLNEEKTGWVELKLDEFFKGKTLYLEETRPHSIMVGSSSSSSSSPYLINKISYGKNSWRVVDGDAILLHEIGGCDLYWVDLG